MRIVIIAAGLLLLSGPPAIAQILCAPLPQTVAIGEVSARPAVKTIMSVIPISCHNTGNAHARETVSIIIGTPTTLLFNLNYDSTLPANIGFLTGAAEPATSLCREVELEASEHITFDLPIQVRIRIASEHWGHYQTSFTVSAQSASPCT